MAWKSQIPMLVARLAAVDELPDEIGRHMETVAQAHARVRTGYMRENIRWDPTAHELRGGAPYTVFNEFGTRYMSAQPMFQPALEAGRRMLDREIPLLLL
jgi:hypothetical protein